MSTNTSDLADTRPAPGRPSGWRTWITVALCLLIFLGGGVVGSGITVMHVGKQVKDRIQHPDLLPLRVASRLQDLLDLTDEQAREAQRIVERHYGVIRDAKEEMQRVVEPEIDAIGAEVSALLTPDRARRFEERFKTFREECFPHLSTPRRGR